MCYESMPFPPSTPLFPKASVVADYLRLYAKTFDLMPHIRLNTSVASTIWNGASWSVTLSTGEELEYDRLVVANGHYRVPFYPPVPGLDKWLSEKRATHSVYYRSPRPLGERILVIGAGPSGNDISTEMHTVCKTLFHSVPNPGEPSPNAGNIEKRARVVRFSTDDSRTVFFSDGSSESGIDHVFLATGYLQSFPFLSTLPTSTPGPVPPLPAHLHKTGTFLFPLARELFPLAADFPPWSAAFIGLPLRVSPFPLCEAQMRAVSHVFAHPDALDPRSESVAVVERYEALRARFGDDPEVLAHEWHRFSGNEQFEYRDALHALAGLNGPEHKVPDWSIEFYDKKVVLREEWIKLEASGEAEEWLKGVGEGGMQEWIDFMRKLCTRAEEVAPAASSKESKL